MEASPARGAEPEWELLTLRGLAMTDKDHVRVIGLHGNGTGIGMGELLHHLQALPALPRVTAGEDLTRGGGKNGLGPH